jgi:hypothetical protein
MKPHKESIIVRQSEREESQFTREISCFAAQKWYSWT